MSALIRLAILAAALTSPVAAQLASTDAWKLTGRAGFLFRDTSQTSKIETPAATDSTSDYRSIGGEIWLGLQGFALDPKFLPFSVDFGGIYSGNSVQASDYRNSILNWGVNTTFLPSRPYPLRVYYRRATYAATGSVFDQNTATDMLGIDWSVQMERLPKMTVSFQNYANTIHFPTSASDTNNHQKQLNLTADDTWKGWNWNAGFTLFHGSATLVNEMTAPGENIDHYRGVTARARRPFWGNRAEFRTDNFIQWRESDFDGAGSSDTREINSALNLRLQHTSKFSTSYSYGFIQVDQRSAQATPTSQNDVIFLQPPTFRSNDAGVHLDYRLNKWIGLFEQVRYYSVTPDLSPLEQRTSLTESLTGGDFHGHWKSVLFSGRAAERFQLMGTNRSNHTHAFSPDLDGRVDWGNPKRIRFTALATYSRLNLVEQLLGFSEFRRFRVEARKQYWHGMQFQVSFERSQTALLNISGKNEVQNTLLGFQVEHKRFSAGYTRNLSDGAGAVFSSPIYIHPITEPLPVDQLVNTPLLDRTVQGNSAFGVFRVFRDLEVSAIYRDEHSLFFNSDQTYRTYEVHANYRLAKFTFEAAFGEYDSNILPIPGNPSGLHVRRLQFRVTRDFRVF